MRRLALCLILAACASSATQEVEFSWLEGCWRDANSTFVWTRLEDSLGWEADVRIASICLAERDERDNCRYAIRREEGVWTFRDEITDNIRTYRLIETEGTRAMFQALSNPLRDLPARFLTIAVDADRYSMTETGGIVPITWADAERC